MGPTATWLTTRAVLRRTWRTGVVLALMIGVVGGIVAATLAGANRIAGAYASLLAEVDAPDTFTGAQCDPNDERDCPTQIEAQVAVLRADPAIADVGTIRDIYPLLRSSKGTLLGPNQDQECSTENGELALLSSEWHRTGRPFARIVSGRFPDPAAVDEIAVPAVTAEGANLRVGDIVHLEGWCHGDLPAPSEPLSLTVVGIFVGVLDVRPPGAGAYFEGVVGTPALEATLGGAEQSLLPIWLNPGFSVADLDDVFTLFDVAAHATVVEESLQPDVTGLRLFAAAAALAALAVLGQLLANSGRSAVAETQPLHALGARPRDRWVVGMMCGVAVGIGAAVAAAVTAAAVLPLVPAGAADVILRGNWGSVSFATVVFAALATLVAVIVVSLLPTWLAARARPRPPRLSSPRLPSRVARSLRLGPAPSIGMRFALEPAGATQPVPLRTGLGAMVVATAAVAGVITFAAGLEHLRTTPRLVGWTWDLLISLEGDNGAELPSLLAARSDVERSSAGIIFTPGFSADSSEASQLVAFGLDSGPGAVQPAVIRGRAPEGPDEVLLAPGLADRLDLDVGGVAMLNSRNPLGDLLDELEVSPDGLDIEPMLTLPYEVVGVGVVPDFLSGRLDNIMTLSLDGVDRAFPPSSRAIVMEVYARADPMLRWRRAMSEVPPEVAIQLAILGPDRTLEVLEGWSDEQFAPLLPDEPEAQVVIVDLQPGTKVSDFIDDLERQGLVSEEALSSFGTRDQAHASFTDLVNLDLDDAAWIPAVFGELMALTTLAVLVHVVVTGARARRRDLAVLRALGLNSRQVRRTVAWQAMTLTIVTLAIAVPVGVVAGRFAWHRYAESVDVVPESVTPWSWLLVLVITMMIVTLLVSVLPARRAIRRRPIESLRSE